MALAVSDQRVGREAVAANDSRLLLGDGVKEDRRAVRPLVAIAVACDDDRHRLTEILGAVNAKVVAHENLRTLRRSLLRDNVDLVITDVTLADANWADVLRLIVRASLSTGILVHSRAFCETLRSEVVWRGGDGILIPPYSFEGVSKVIQQALPAAGVRNAVRGQSKVEEFHNAVAACCQEEVSL